MTMHVHQRRTSSWRRSSTLAASTLVAPAAAQEDTGTPAAGGPIVVAGSATVGPILEAAAEAFAAQAPGIDVAVERSSSGAGLERFCNGETDIATSGRRIRDDEGGGLRGSWCRLRRVRGRLRRRCRRRQSRQRRRLVPDRRATRAALGTRLRRSHLAGPRRWVAGGADRALRHRERVRHLPVLHPGARWRRGCLPRRLRGDRRPSRPPPSGWQPTPTGSASSPSPATSRTRTG